MLRELALGLAPVQEVSEYKSEEIFKICLREVVGDEVVDLLEVCLQAAARSGWALLLEIIILRIISN